MGIVRTSTTRVLAPLDQTFRAVVEGMRAEGLDLSEGKNPITGKAKRAVMKNRWAAEVTAGVRPESDTTTLVDWSVDMAGDKHGAVLADIVEAMPADIDDLGVKDALERLGMIGRFFGRREAAALTQFIHTDERVVELASGIYDGSQGMLVLTTQRLFFFDKSLLGAKVEEFEFNAIGSLGYAKRMGGEVINISISGRSAEIKQVAHGRAESLIQAFRRMRGQNTATAVPPLMQAAPEIADQIRKLAELRDAGILSEDEFATKKADLLSRM